jgi:2,3-bisphosphoglycerate-independent phosphoglycerate mutase
MPWLGMERELHSVLFFNFREDRARQISRVFVDNDFDNFNRNAFPGNLYFATMTGYESDLNTKIIFPPKPIHESLASTLSKHRLKQLHISETEKFAHISYFFNGGKEVPHAGETFFNIPSPKVYDYSRTPHMSAEVIKDEVIYRLENLDKEKYSFIVINFANPDILGHTGNLDITKEGVEYIDSCVKEVVQKTVEKNGVAILIADHGNCEVMIDPVTKKVHTSHTNNPVPFIVIDDYNQISAEAAKKKMYKIGTGKDAQVTGILADVAPTVLSILDIEPPPSMTGIDLLSVV